MQIQLDVTDGTLTAVSVPTLVSQNTGYTVLVSISPVLHGRAFIVCEFEQDGKNITTETELDGETALAAFPTAYGAVTHVRVEQEHREPYDTNKIWLPIEPSIKSAPTRAYSAPYDAYNDIMRYLNTDDETARETILARLTYHAEHPEAYPGTAYKRAITALARYTKLSGTLTTTAGTEIPFTDEEIKDSSLTISTNAMSSDYLLPGGVPCAKLDVTLYDKPNRPADLHGAEIAPVFNIMLETGRWFTVPLGVYTVATETDGSASGLPITAYDDMHKLDDVKTADLGFAEYADYSPDQIVSAICEAAGIPYTPQIDFNPDLTGRTTHAYVCVLTGSDPDDRELWGYMTVIRQAEDMTPAQVQARLDALYHGAVTYRGDKSYPNDLPAPTDPSVDRFDAFRVMYDGPTYMPEMTTDTAETARDLLMNTLFTVNGIAEIDAQRRLIVKPIKALSAASDAEMLSENQTTSRQISRYPYRLHRLTTVVDFYENLRIRQSEKWTGETLWLSGDTVNAEAPSNALYPTTSVVSHPYTEIQTQLARLVSLLDPVEYYPMQVAMRGDPTIGLLDWIRTDDDHAAPVTSRVWKYRGTQTLAACGESAVAGAVQSQAEKQATSDKLAVSASLQDTMLAIDMQLMASYAGMANFTHSDIAHFTHAEIGGEGE